MTPSYLKKYLEALLEGMWEFCGSIFEYLIYPVFLILCISLFYIPSGIFIFLWYVQLLPDSIAWDLAKGWFVLVTSVGLVKLKARDKNSKKDVL